MADGAKPVVDGEEVPYSAMGPSLLSQQPVDSTPEHRPQGWWVVVQQRLEARLGTLRSWRWSWWSHWSRLAEYFLPRRYVWLVVANRMWRGSPINDAIIDSTPVLAVRTCASGMWTGLTSPSRPWFTIELGLPWIDLDEEGQAWIEDTQEKAYTVLAQSNFYTVMAQAFQDVTVFGTSPVIMYEDYEDVIRCYVPCAGEYYLAAGARLSVDTLYREFTFTIAEIVEMFDVANCPQQVIDMWNQGGGSIDAEMVVAHSIEPNFGISRRDGGPAITVVPGSFTWREVYWLKGVQTDKPLSARGFTGNPFFVARWSTVSNDAYGRSPCMDALGDNKQIQLETKRKAEYIDKGVRPPMGADPSLKNEPSSIISGQVTYIASDKGKTGFWPLFDVEPAWLVGITADIKDVASRIEKCLFVDLFMAISRMDGVQPRNELELTQRNMERLQELGPFVQQFQNEFAGPAVKRLLDIMMRRNILKPLPQSLRGQPLKINYVSIMKLAQNATESVSMKDVFSVGGVLSAASQAAGVPNPVRQLNLDKAYREYGKRNNFPETIWYPEDEVQKMDEQRTQKENAAAMVPATMAAVNATKTLSETPVGGDTALTALMGGQR